MLWGPVMWVQHQIGDTNELYFWNQRTQLGSHMHASTTCVHKNNNTVTLSKVYSLYKFSTILQTILNCTITLS